MKKVLGSLVMVLLMVFMFSGFASAAVQSSANDVMQLVQRTNVQIQQDIKGAQLDADKLMKSYQQIRESCAGDVKLLKEAEKNYNEEMDKIINDLVNTTNARAHETMSIAAENGYTVVCEMVEVVIGDRTVLIDPLRVVGI